MGQESLFQADEENDGEFEALGGVQGDEGCSLFLLQIVVFAFGGEGAGVEEGLELFAFFDVGAEAVSRIKTLEVLDISDTAITDVGLQQLASLPNLGYLGISNIRVSAECIAAIKEQHPELQVESGISIEWPPR